MTLPASYIPTPVDTFRPMLAQLCLIPVNMISKHMWRKSLILHCAMLGLCTTGSTWLRGEPPRGCHSKYYHSLMHEFVNIIGKSQIRVDCRGMCFFFSSFVAALRRDPLIDEPVISFSFSYSSGEMVEPSRPQAMLNEQPVVRIPVG